MAHKLTLFSGKGGSGKTTIALCLAKMFSECNIKTLLIDCDIATNGATYFFEKKFTEKEKYKEFYDLFLNECKTGKQLFFLSELFAFIPANLYFPNEGCPEITTESGKALFLNNIQRLENDFDMIIFDCQAGYSSILSIMLNVSTVNLIVLEPDSISISSIRVLYAQVSALIEKTATYQIYNKITKEECEIYKDFVYGMFNALPPIEFNWEVRKAFAYAKIPEMANTDIDFGKDVYALSTLLFPALESQLLAYQHKILKQEKEEAELLIKRLKISSNETLENSGNDSIVKIHKKTMLSFLLLMLSLITIIFSFSNGILKGFQSGMNYIMILIAISFGILSYSYILNSLNKMQEIRKANRNKYDYEYSKLNRRLEDINKSIYDIVENSRKSKHSKTEENFYTPF